MLIKLSKVLLSAAFVMVLAVSTILPQQLDPTFGGSPRPGIRFVYFGLGISSYQVLGVKAFPRADNSLAFLVWDSSSFVKTTAPVGMTVVSLPPDGATFTYPLSIPHKVLAVDGAKQSDEKIVAVGSDFNNWFIERFNPDGTRDDTFNSNGIVRLDFSGRVDKAANVSIQANGKIVVSGTSTSTRGSVTLIARFNTNGSLDTGFGPYGNGMMDLYDNAVLSREMTIRPDGKVLLAGTYPSGAETVSMFYLINPDGSPDITFGDGGLVYAVDNGVVTLAEIKPQTDGKAVVLATREFVPVGASGFSDQEILIRRLNTNGSIDTAFGENGLVAANTSPPTHNPALTFEPSGAETAKALLVESTGNIVAVLSSAQVVPARGYNGHFPGRSARVFPVYLLRYDPSGRLIGKNISRATRAPDVFSVYSPIDISGVFEQPGKGTVVYGTLVLGSYLGPVPVPGQTFPEGFLARYSTIAAENDAKSFYDYNFDGRAEFATYHPATTGFSKWQLARSFPDAYGAHQIDFGLAGDSPVPGDYDGDGIQDLAVFRDSIGDWFTRKIYLYGCAPMDCTEQVHFGQTGDVPAPGDFDGDGMTDRAVFRPSEGNWYILYSSTGGWTGLHFGQNGDLPVTGDYDNDGRSDVAVVRRENGLLTWYVLQSSDNQFVGIHFGLETDKAVPADYNGDGKTDIAVFRDGYWYFLFNYADFSYRVWGLSGDIPEPADYNADGLADVAVYRSRGPGTFGDHYASGSGSGELLGFSQGMPGDVPLPAAYVR